MTKAQHPTKRMKIAARRRAVAELVLSGERSTERIANELGVTSRTIRYDLDRLEDEYRRIGSEIIGRLRDQERGVELLRLERYVNELTRRLEDNPGDYVQVYRLLKEISERKSKLLGLDQPTKHAATDPTGQYEAGGRISSSFKQKMMEEGIITVEAIEAG